MHRDPVEELLIDWLELPIEARESALDRLCGRHPELADELRTRAGLLSRLETTAPRDETGERLGEFQLLRQLGGGGMGVVYLARQARPGLEREVALKVVRQGAMFTAETRERFAREARAALRLDHPAICPVLDVGEADGTPYIAMRHVPGETLAKKIAAARESGLRLELTTTGTGGDEPSTRTTSRRSLDHIVALVETVGRALHTAHDAGLVHRDVKPGNIMVTPAGDPVLLDFGLVRDDEDATRGLTLTNQPIGTPAYMSPEQVRGDIVDRTTDVYSLGTTLYECLTTRPPFQARTREALYLAILRDEPPPVHRLDPSVPRDLAIVVATAMAKEPARRYRTALELAEDLRRVRRLEPIRARPAGVGRRLALWGKRNPIAAAFCAVLCVSSGALAVQTINLDHARDDAVEARNRAVREFREARDAVDELIQIARDDLRDVPRVEHVRQRLMTRALGFHERFLDEHPDDAELLSDATLSQELRGILLYELGRLPQAEAALKTAIAQLDELAARHGEQPALLHRAARSRAALADVRADRGHPDDAVTILEQVVATLERRTEARARQLLARALDSLGDALIQGDEKRRAQEVLRRSLTIYRELAATDPSPSLQIARARVRIELARALTLTHDFAAAREQYEAAIETLERQRPTNTVLTALAFGRRTFGAQLRLRGLPDEARAQYEAALAVQERLAAENPDTPKYAQAVSDLHYALGHLSAGAEALAHYRRGLAVAEQLHAEFPDAVDPAFLVADGHYNIGGTIRRTDVEAAKAAYRAASDLLEPLVAKHGAETRLRRLLGTALNNESVMHWETGDHALAVERMELAVQHKRTLCELEPEDPQYRLQFAVGLGNLAKHRARLGPAEEAEELFERCIALHHEVAEAHPDVTDYAAGVLVAHIRCAAYFDDSTLVRAVDWLEALPPDRLAHYSTSARFRDRLRRVRLGHAILLVRRQRWTEAHAELQPLRDQYPDDEQIAALWQRVRAKLKDR